MKSLGLSGYELLEQYVAARYEQQAGQLLTHNGDSSCFVAADDGKPASLAMA